MEIIIYIFMCFIFGWLIRSFMKFRKLLLEEGTPVNSYFSTKPALYKIVRFSVLFAIVAFSIKIIILIFYMLKIMA